jgi:type I restriction enzyme R subunit
VLVVDDVENSVGNDDAVSGSKTVRYKLAEIEALLDKYMNSGIYEVENLGVLQLDPFRKFGKPNKIADFFGGKEGYLKAVKELEQAIYEGVG